MYEYQNAIVKHRKPEARFEELDVRNMSIKSLLRTYENIYLVLIHPIISLKHTLDMRKHETLFVMYPEDMTVGEWLTANGNTTLPTDEGIPDVRTTYVMARDAWQAGFTVDICVPSGSPFNDGTDYDKTDIWLRRKDTDYSKVRQYSLATINGYVHRLDSDGDGAYVKDGATTFRRSQAAHVGLLSFLNIGKIHTASITPEMVYNPDETKLFSDSFYLKVPFDTSNKVMGIVIGGFLHLASSDFKVIGSNAMKVFMSRIPFLDRYMTSRYKLDQTSMERFHQINETNELDYDLQKFYSNECIIELLGQSQSFIVGIEVDHLNTTVHQTTRTFLPGRFYFDERPLYPLRTELGLLPSFISAEENGIWVIRIDSNMNQQREMHTRNFRWQDKVDEKRLAGNPETFSRGEMIKWSTSKLTIIPEVVPE
jgi:hypothetical protein